MGKVLNKERVRSLNYFRGRMKKAVQEMIKIEKNPTLKAAYERALTNLETVPIKFYPKDTLMRAVFKIGKHFVASEVLGQHEQKIRIKREGGIIKVVPDGRLIELPADHFFHGDKLNWKGVHTLMHEICHDPTRNVFDFSREAQLTPNQTEELIADLMSAKIAIKMGFKRESVLGLYHGREAIYGRFPFREYLERATESKTKRVLRKTKELPKKWKERKRKKERKPSAIYNRPRVRFA